jgi:hypothetical protein
MVLLMATNVPDQATAVSRLAQYRPFSDEGRDMTAALEDVVLGAAAVAGGRFPSLAACQDGIRDLWGLDLEMDEIRTVVANLQEDDRCVRDKGGFVLSAGELEAREEAAAESSALEMTALSDWKALLLRLEPRLTTDDFDLLRHDLMAWLSRVVARHGVEAALVLYPENPRAQELFRSLETLGLAFLPKREGPVGAVRDRGFAFFVRQPTEAQRQFLANLLNTSFYLTVLTLDPAGSQLIQKKVSGHRVYLDTNVLYSILGLSKPSEVLSANRLLELSRNLGYELAVTPWTVHELRTSLNGAKHRIMRRPLPRRELAELMVRAGGDHGSFVTAFWVAYRDRGIQPKDFFEYFDHIETLLESHEIRVVKEGCAAVDQDQAAIGEQTVLLDRFLGWSGREDKVMEHDVKHRLLVERLRGDGHLRFSNARYWFLTQDSKLPRYGAATLEDDPVELSFCVSSSAWAQVVRAFTPRTADYDQTIVDLLATPYLRYRGAVNPRVVEEVVARIDQFEGADVGLASEVLADTALVRDIAQAEDDDDRVEKIENAFVVKAKELQTRLDETIEREAETRSAAATARETADNEAALRIEAERLLTREREVRELAEKALVDRVAEHETATRSAQMADKIRAEAQQSLGKQLEDLRRWLRWVAAAALAICGLGVGVGPLIAGALHGTTAIVIALCSGALLIFSGVVVAFGRHRGGRLVMGAITVIGFVGAVYTIVESVRPRSK